MAVIIGNGGVGERLKPAVLKNADWYYPLIFLNDLRYTLIPIFGSIWYRFLTFWATKKEVGQQLGLAVI
jgi:hypothetical protein